MKNFTLLLFISCCFANFNSKAQCYATIGVQSNPNALGATLWADNFIGDSANTTFSWIFCDGTADSGFNVFHTFTSNGGCRVCLTLTDNNTGCNYTTCDSINAGGIPFNPCTAYTTYTNQDSLYTFFAASIGGLPVMYEWSVNGIPADTTPSITVILDSLNAINGGTLVCVTITDASGCVASDCIALGNNSGNPTGGGVPCQAYFIIYPDTGMNNGGQPGYYIGENRSTGNYGADILWDFGDGTTSTDPYPMHNYPIPGNYIVCLTVGIAGTNCYDTYCDSSFYVFKTEGGQMSHLSFAGPTDIRETSNSRAIHVFPNPVASELNWLSDNRVEQVRIFDLSGRKVFDSAANRKINVSKLSTGVYFLQIYDTEGVLSGIQKFVKE